MIRFEMYPLTSLGQEHNHNNSQQNAVIVQ